jgi:catechol 2,3-dioxygenase-like lactoylglutathione lyase family enzyme
MGAPRVIGVDHIVLNVADVERSLAFYRDLLGLAAVRVEEWRRAEAPFPSVRVTETMIIDLVQAAPTGANLDHFCLVVEPTDLDALAATGRFDVVSGPGTRFGAQGDGLSLYVRDPDGNTVELRYYP